MAAPNECASNAWRPVGKRSTGRYCAIWPLIQRLALNEIDCPRLRLPEEAIDPPGLTPEGPRSRPCEPPFLKLFSVPILKLFDASSIESSISLRSGAETRGWSVTFRSSIFVYCAR